VSLPVIYHRLAGRDLVAARRWYEEQDRGLGDRFVGAVQQTVEQIARWPNAATPAARNPEGDVVERIVPTPGFPFTIRYRVRDGHLLVVAIYHQHRQPDFGSRRS
jgi:plasmid stabilization system protein ParE